MKFNRIILLSVLALGLVSQSASAMVRWSVYGGVNKSTAASVDVSGFTVAPALGYDAGLSAELPLANMVGLEIGAFYENSAIKVTDDAAATSTTTNLKGLGFPVLLRLWLGHMVSLGGGGYYSSSLETGGGSDYGAAGSLRFSLPLGSSASFLIDGRYLLGMKDHAGSKEKEWQGLAGIMFGGHK